MIQTAVAYLAANLCVVDFTAEGEVLTSALVGLGVSALAAGLAAVMNMEKTAARAETDDSPEEVENS
jgi:hypothetical protein